MWLELPDEFLSSERAMGWNPNSSFTPILKTFNVDFQRISKKSLAVVFLLMYVVLVKSCRQSKHTAAHVLPRQKMLTASFAKAKDATTSFA